MQSLVISVFTSNEVVPVYGTVVDEDVVMIQVCDTSDWRNPEYYDFRFLAPVQEHLLCEVEQLVSDLCRDHVVHSGGLQPQLFP